MLFCKTLERVNFTRNTAKHIPSWFPRDLINPLFYLSGCSLLVTWLILTPFSHVYLQALWVWLPWNIFLAWLPLFFALCVLWASHKNKRGLRLLTLPCWALFLFFYPNSPYMLTNLIHLNRFQFYSHGQFSADPATWFVFLILITGVATGCGFGLLSLVMLQRHIKQKHGAIWGCLLITTVSLSSGIAIWIGRILRFNSWDIVFRPFFLIRNIIAQFDFDAFLLCVLFAIMSAGTYLLFRVFLNETTMVPAASSEG